MQTLLAPMRALSDMIARVPSSLVQLVLRIALAVPFWNSGVLKWESFPLKIKETAVYLFAEEFKLHLPWGQVSFPFPEVTAHLVALAEVSFPVLLVAGLLTRFAGLGVLAMSLVIQLTVPDGWPVHLTWAAMALAIMAHGAGNISLDRLLGIGR
jgi:putative oxidoreductase